MPTHSNKSVTNPSNASLPPQAYQNVMGVFDQYSGNRKVPPKTMRAGFSQPLLDLGQQNQNELLPKVNFNIDEMEEM